MWPSFGDQHDLILPLSPDLPAKNMQIIATTSTEHLHMPKKHFSVGCTSQAAAGSGKHHSLHVVSEISSVQGEAVKNKVARRKVHQRAEGRPRHIQCRGLHCVRGNSLTQQHEEAALAVKVCSGGGVEKGTGGLQWGESCNCATVVLHVATNKTRVCLKANGSSG